jgi:hypothetical protein
LFFEFYLYIQVNIQLEMVTILYNIGKYTNKHNIVILYNIIQNIQNIQKTYNLFLRLFILEGGAKRERVDKLHLTHLHSKLLY